MLPPPRRRGHRRASEPARAERGRLRQCGGRNREARGGIVLEQARLLRRFELRRSAAAILASGSALTACASLARVVAKGASDLRCSDRGHGRLRPPDQESRDRGGGHQDARESSCDPRYTSPTRRSTLAAETARRATDDAGLVMNDLASLQGARFVIGVESETRGHNFARNRPTVA